MIMDHLYQFGHTKVQKKPEQKKPINIEKPMEFSDFSLFCLLFLYKIIAELNTLTVIAKTINKKSNKWRFIIFFIVYPKYIS